ncbi:adenosylmethionine decarboxylase [Candidatus Sumerlaeota bacterium]|nr:adenosylmethionine decarboxylase [Candidatus Sumerlaeota bacterium]
MENTLTSNTTLYCGQQGDMLFAGSHLLVELWQARHLNDGTRIRQILIEAIEAVGATLLSVDLHVFSPNGGVSGVAILQESHMSIHTWPEFEYAAIDLFVCGTVDPYKAIPVIKEAFAPGRFNLVEMKRGIMPGD